MGDAPRDPDREAILARRNRFLAMALSGMAVTGCAEPVPCLVPVVPVDAGSPADASPPAPCLGAPIGDAGTGDPGAGDAGAESEP